MPVGEPIRWPDGHVADTRSTVELTAEYDKEVHGTSKLKVKAIRVVQQTSEPDIGAW